MLAALALLLVAVVLYYRLLIRSHEQSRYTAAVEALVEKDPKVRKLTAGVNPQLARKIFDSAEKPLSAVERQYILLFMSGSSTEEIANAMNVDVSSVYISTTILFLLFPEQSVQGIPDKL